jgi:formylglycine-generating enzyme
MSVKSFISAAAFAIAVGLGTPIALAQITIPTVLVGDPGNAADRTTGFGSVAYTYNIGTTEVTNAQYAAFLNAVAATDTNDLYNTGMAGAVGGITRSGLAGSYRYETPSGRANNPVSFIRFWDAARFANWLHNGQPIGGQNNSTTEDGAYTLTPASISGNTVTRNAGATWALPTEDEWYKAAYGRRAGSPAAQVGYGANGYSVFPMQSDEVPSAADGNFSNVLGGTTAVGSYAANFYGTFDMGGNVWEWNEAIIDGTSRGVRGGSFHLGVDSLRASSRNRELTSSTSAWNTRGFRVAQVPGPSAVALLSIGGVVVMRRRR